MRLHSIIKIWVVVASLFLCLLEIPVQPGYASLENIPLTLIERKMQNLAEANTWHTFLGSSGQDFVSDLAFDQEGNIYLVGSGDGTWGPPPIYPYGGLSDGFVAKLDRNGILQWYTFIGSSLNPDSVAAITLDKVGNIYIAGTSLSTWGSAPLRPYRGGSDGFVAKLNNKGILQWNTFLGLFSQDSISSIALDEAGGIYVGGTSETIWDSGPMNSHAGDYDAFVARLDNSGLLQWYTFMGSPEYDEGTAIALDPAGNIYMTGWGHANWGASPVNPYNGQVEAFVAKLNNNGVRQWHTFMGSSAYDFSHAIVTDEMGNIYAVGNSDDTWGDTPIRGFAGWGDAFVVKLSSNGVRQWHTFLGSASWDEAWDVAIDSTHNIYIVGTSNLTWGHPINPYAGGTADAFAAKLSNNGRLEWNTFMGAGILDEDIGSAIIVDEASNVYVAGTSFATWGPSPIYPYRGHRDSFVAKIHVFNLNLPLILKNQQIK